MIYHGISMKKSIKPAHDINTMKILNKKKCV